MLRQQAGAQILEPAGAQGDLIQQHRSLLDQRSHDITRSPHLPPRELLCQFLIQVQLIQGDLVGPVDKPHLHWRSQAYNPEIIRQAQLIRIAERLTRALCVRIDDRQIVATQNHVLGRPDDRLARRRFEQVDGTEHEIFGFLHCLIGQGHMDSHLIAVEVSVERRANERVNLNRTTVDQDHLKGLDAQAVKRRRAVQQHGPLACHFLKDVPHLRAFAVHQALGALDVVRVVVFHEPPHDEGLEQLKRHLLRQTTLMQLKLRTDDDD